MHFQQSGVYKLQKIGVFVKFKEKIKYPGLCVKKRKKLK